MTSTPSPHAVARAGVGLAVRWLPELDDRLRYRAEFLAELHDLTLAGQLRYTAGVLSQTFALRAALGSTPSSVEEDAMTLTRTPFYWRCRVLHLHRPGFSAARRTEAGTTRCSRCWPVTGATPRPAGGPNLGFMLLGV